jgi:tetratricopeptide (TPR) repeat protein
MSVRRFFSNCVSGFVCFVALSAISSSAAAQSPALTGAARWADTVQRTLDAAVMAGDVHAIRSAKGLAERALLAFPDDAMLLHYQGTAIWREAQLRLGMQQEDEAKVLFERAIAVLQRSAAAQQLPETQAIIASSYGSLAGGGMTAGIRYGPRANEAEGLARELGPQNPRVLLITGISAYYKPAAFGGGKDKARTAVTQAIAAFAREQVNAPLPAWGHAEAYAWLGQFEAAEGNREAARRAYTRALELAPQYTWVSRVLLPALDRPR